LIARNDLLRVEVELSTAQQRLLRAEGDQHNTRKALARTLGRGLDKGETIEDFSKLPEPPHSEFADLQQRMFFARSELRFLHNLLAAQHSGQKAVRGDYLPEVDLVLSYERFGDGGLPQTSDSNYDSYSRAMVEANWTLFSGFDTHYEIAGRREEIRARQKEIRATEDQLTLQLQVALEEHRVAQGNLETAELGVEQAEENYRVNENRYKARVATTVDLLDAQEFLTRARNEQVKARYDLYLAAVALERILEQGPSLPE
jgi:outer membrane protein TolC